MSQGSNSPFKSVGGWGPHERTSPSSDKGDCYGPVHLRDILYMRRKDVFENFPLGEKSKFLFENCPSILSLISLQTEVTDFESLQTCYSFV